MSTAINRFQVFKKDGIWKFYLRADSGELAECKTCKKIIKCSGGSTKGLHTHQKTVHNVELLKRDADVNEDRKIEKCSKKTK